LNLDNIIISYIFWSCILHDRNPKRIASIQKHNEKGIDITSENILKVYQEENNNIAQTAHKIGCSWRVVKSVICRKE
jgi:hypothetical protein